MKASTQRQPLDETDAGDGKQVQQWRAHTVYVGFVEARTDTQFGLGRKQCHAYVGTVMLVEQTYGAQCTS